MTRTMKDSGVAWIGEIPEKWNKDKVVRIFGLIGSGTTPRSDNPDYYEGDIHWIQSGDINGGFLTNTKVSITQEAVNRFTALKLYHAPFIIMAMYGASIGNISQSSIDACVNQACCVLINSSLDMQYCFYTLKVVKDYLVWKSVGGGQPNISQETIKQLWLPVPPSEEQDEIAAYLDTRCAKIDAIIAQTRETIDEYKKLKQSIITEAVTKGIRPGRKMKDSGIEWIGEIPEEWEVRRIKALFTLRDEKNTLPLSEVNLISLYTDLGVVQHCDLEKTTGNKASNADGYKKVYENDIIVNIILCWMGAIGRSAYTGVTSPAYDVYVPSNEIECQFYHHYFRTKGFSGDCYKRGRGIMAMRWRTYSDQFRDIPVVVPPIQEQREILAYLNEKSARIDALIAQKEQLAAELETYKKSLIYEYVTGKKEVKPS